MDIERIKKLSDEMLKKFVNCLGLNGDYYASVNKTHIIFGVTSKPCCFLTPRSGDLRNLLNRLNIDEKYKRYFFDAGLIIINRDMKNVTDKKSVTDLLVTVIHEKLHANRVILTNAQYSNNREIHGVLHDDHFVKHSFNDKAYYADSSQDILKASIDDSYNTVKKYSQLTDQEKADMTEDDFEYDYKMDQQYKIDEALVETMAIIANQLYEQNSDDIMSIVKKINEKYDGDIKGITNIILRHNDLELFKWMIDPITYEAGVANYDFFAHYIKEEDLGDLNDIMESEDVMFNDDEFDKNIIESRKKNSK